MVLKKELEKEIETLQFSVRAYKGQHTKMKKVVENLQEVNKQQERIIQILKATKARKHIPQQVKEFIKKQFPNLKLF